MLNDVLGNTIRNQVPQRSPGCGPAPNNRRGYPHFGGLDHYVSRIRAWFAVPGTGNSNESGELLQAARIAPLVQPGKRIGPGNEEELRIRQLRVQVRKGVDCKGLGAARDVHIRHLKTVIVHHCKPAHIEPLLGCSRRRPLEGLLQRGHDDDGIQREGRVYLAGDNQVPQVNRVERSPQNADAAVTHPDDGYRRS